MCTQHLAILLRTVVLPHCCATYGGMRKRLIQGSEVRGLEGDEAASEAAMAAARSLLGL